MIEQTNKNFGDGHAKNVQVTQDHPQKRFSLFRKSNKFIPKTSFTKSPLRIIPIGGLDKVGGNAMVAEYENDMIIMDCGILFADASLPGVDYVIPDMTYAEQNKHKLKAIIITHGHLDHIGALRFVVTALNFPPIYATPLAIELIKKYFEEVGLLGHMKSKLHIIDPSKNAQFGKINVEFFRVNHSFPDSVGLYVTTPAGTFVHTGDFKVDFNPTDTFHSDLIKMADIGKRGVDLLMADSTNAAKEGFTKMEQGVADSLRKIIGQVKGRIIISTFALLFARIQEIIKYAEENDRIVFLNGKALLDNLTIANHLGMLKYKKGTLRKLTKEIDQIPENKVMILTTGSQGEAFSGLTRMANGKHPLVNVGKGDTVIISASPIPQNIESVVNMVNLLIKKKAEVFSPINSDLELHASGHGSRGDLRLLMSLVKPKYVAPIHGETYMRKCHQELAISLGIPEKNALMINQGEILEIVNGEVKLSKEKLELIPKIVENNVIGDIFDSVIDERLMMKTSGFLMIIMKVDKKDRSLMSQPKIISRGFVFKNEIQPVYKDILTQTTKIYSSLLIKDKAEQHKQVLLVDVLRSKLGKYIFEKFNKEPVIVPVFIEQ